MDQTTSNQTTVYTLSESTIPGYTASAWSCVGGTQVDNTIELSEGESATCTITNTDDVANQLTLVKQVVNANGGNNDASDWTLTASGDDGFSGTGTPNGDDTIATTRTKQRQIKRSIHTI